MAQYGEEIELHRRTIDEGFASYVERLRTERGATAAVAVIGLLVAVSLYAAVTAPAVAGLAVVGAGVLFLVSRYALSANDTPAVVETVSRLRYDVKCPHCTTGISVPVGNSVTCPACACSLTLTP